MLSAVEIENWFAVPRTTYGRKENMHEIYSACRVKEGIVFGRRWEIVTFLKVISTVDTNTMSTCMKGSVGHGQMETNRFLESSRSQGSNPSP